MSPSPMACPVCRALNDPRGERCYCCGHQFQRVAVFERGQWRGDPLPGRPGKPGTTSVDGLSHVSRTSRRTALLIVGGVVGGAIGLPVVAVGGYLLYQHLTDPHILTYDGHSNTTSDAAWSPNGTLVASAGWLDGGTVQIWDPLTGQRLHTCQPEHVFQDIYPQRVIWSADGKQVLAFVGRGGGVMVPGSRVFEQVQVWDVASGQRVRNIPLMEPVTVNTLGTGTDRSLLYRWALSERYFAAVQTQMNASADQNHDILEVWEIASGNKIAALDSGSTLASNKILGLAWAPDQTTLAIDWNIQDASQAKYYHSIVIWDRVTRSRISTLNLADFSSVRSVRMAWAPDSSKLLLLLASGSGTVYKVWDARQAKKIHTFRPAAAPGESLAIWSPDGRYLALQTSVYDVQTGNLITTYPLQGNLGSLAWSPDSKRMALADSIKHGAGFSSTSSTLYILDALSGKQRAAYSGRGLFGNEGASGNLSWSPNGKYLMVVGPYVDIWNTGA